jgi:hypothetical protein
MMKTCTLVMAAGALLAAASVVAAGPAPYVTGHNMQSKKKVATKRPVMLSSVTDSAFSDNFDSYAAGSGIAGQGGWQLWSNLPGENGFVDSTLSSSAPNSLRLDAFADVVRVMDVTSGKWRLTAKTYFPSAHNFSSGYLIGLNTFAIPSGPYHWSLQVEWNPALGVVRNFDDVLGVQVPINYDNWTEVKIEVDLDLDLCNVWYNGIQITTDRIWTEGASGLGGVARIQCWDFFSNGINGFHFDDVVFEPVTGGGCYPNCDLSTVAPILNVDDFTCFINAYASSDPYANCDGSTTPPILNVDDFTCFINAYAQGCP